VFIIKLTGAQILMKALLAEGVDTIFGYPGGAVVDLYDELVKTEIQHILVRHEQGAVHAADGYARASGGVGVCLVTSGPGATNTVSGIASAYMDSIPLVVLTGQVPSHLIGNDAFQEVDIVGITRPCTKHNYLVQRVEDLARTIKEAFYIARSGRPGPVLVDLPKDVIQTATTYKPVQNIQLKSYKPTYEPNINRLYRRRCHPLSGLKRVDAAGKEDPFPCHCLPHGPGELPCYGSTMARYDRDAWDISSKYVVCGM
jgi:acetolactate synthase-1/2/3 large subunit